MLDKSNINIHHYHVLCDIAYDSQSNAQKLDLYYPDIAKQTYPLLFHVHGGAFKKGDKQDHQLRPYLNALKRGFMVASINYRLSNEALFPANILDARKALRFLKENAEKYHIDANHIAAVGGSAGGNVVEMLCCAEKAPFFCEKEEPSLYPSNIQCAVAWFAPTDFLKMDEAIISNGYGNSDHSEPDSPESLYLGKQITLLPKEEVEKANPITYLHKDIPPIFLQHGRRDRIVPYQQSVLFYEQAKAMGLSQVSFEILEQADHSDELFETEENITKILDFIQANIAK